MAPPYVALRAGGALLVLALLVWIGYETVHAGSDIPPPPPGGITHLSGGSASDKRLDGKSWSLDYASATVSADGSVAEIDRIRDGVILRNGRPYMHVRAQHVTANLSTNDFVAVGPVSFTEIGGLHRSLRTDGAHYLGFSQTLVLANRTVIREGPIQVTVESATVNFGTGATTLGRIVGAM